MSLLEALRKQQSTTQPSVKRQESLMITPNHMSMMENASEVGKTLASTALKGMNPPNIKRQSLSKSSDKTSPISNLLNSAPGFVKSPTDKEEEEVEYEPYEPDEIKNVPHLIRSPKKSKELDMSGYPPQAGDSEHPLLAEVRSAVFTIVRNATKLNRDDLTLDDAVAILRALDFSETVIGSL